MIKETITYTDFGGKTRTEDFYFNLSESEIIEMAAENEDLGEKLKLIVAANDGGQIMSIFKDLLRRAYGQKSEDGRRLAKRDEHDRPLFNQFVETNAYNVLFLRLVTEPEYAAKFIEGVLPKNLDAVLTK